MAIPVFYQGGPYKEQANRIARARLEHEKKMLWARPLGDAISGMATAGVKYGLSQIPTGMTEAEKLAGTKIPGSEGLYEKGSPHREMARRTSEAQIEGERVAKGNLQSNLDRMQLEHNKSGIHSLATSGTGYGVALDGGYFGRPGGSKARGFSPSRLDRDKFHDVNIGKALGHGLTILGSDGKEKIFELSDLTEDQKTRYENNQLTATFSTRLGTPELLFRATVEGNRLHYATRATAPHVPRKPPDKYGILIGSGGKSYGFDTITAHLADIAAMSEADIVASIKGRSLNRKQIEFIKAWWVEAGNRSALTLHQAKTRRKATGAYRGLEKGKIARIVDVFNRRGKGAPDVPRQPVRYPYNLKDPKSTKLALQHIHTSPNFQKDAFEPWFADRVGASSWGQGYYKVKGKKGNLSMQDAWEARPKLREAFILMRWRSLGAEMNRLKEHIARQKKKFPDDPSKRDQNAIAYWEHFQKSLLKTNAHWSLKHKNFKTDTSMPWEPVSKKTGGIIPATGTYKLHKGERVVPARGKTVASDDELTMFSAKIAQKNWTASKKRRVVMQKAIELGYA